MTSMQQQAFEKRCRRCGEVKSTDLFHKRRASRDGLQPLCMECDRIAKARRYLRDRDAIRAKRRDYNARNAEANRARSAKWRADNPERYRARIAEYHSRPEIRERDRERASQWYRDNPERGRRTRTEYRDANREEDQAKARERYARDPERTARIKLSGHKRRAAMRGRPTETINLKRVYERDGWRCGICGKKVNRRLKYPHPRSASLDHIVPISQGGGHVYTNVQCSHLGCNLKKKAAGSGEQLLLLG